MKLRIIFLFATIVLVLLPFRVMYAQAKPDTLKRVKPLVIPVLFRSPETRWAFGVAGSLSFKTTFPGDSTTRLSNIQGIVMETQRHQNIEAIDATVYFPQEKYILTLLTSHSYYPDYYWGIGPNTKDTARERYAFEQIHFNPHLKKKIAKDFFAGFVYEYQKLYHIRYQQGGEFDHTPDIGKSDYVVSGAGGSLCYDTRNAAFWPTHGIYAQLMATCFNQVLGSQYNDVKLTTDIRWFQSVFIKHVIAMQFYTYSNIGEAPIRELAAFGGSNNVRGYYQGRYRDKNMYSYVAEYRAPLFWRLSACAFIGMGNVYRKTHDLVASDLKYSYGGGVRLAVLKKERLNIRMDYGYYNRHNKGLYFTVGECF